MRYARYNWSYNVHFSGLPNLLIVIVIRSLILGTSLLVRPRCVVWDRQGVISWIPLPLFLLCRVCPQWAFVSCFHWLPDTHFGFRFRACHFQMHIFGASSLAAAVSPLPGGVFRRSRCLTGLHLIRHSAEFPYKTLQHQLCLLLCFRTLPHQQHSRPQITIWHDVIYNSLTPHSSNFHRPFSPHALIHELCPLPCDIAAIIYCRRTALLM